MADNKFVTLEALKSTTVRLQQEWLKSISKAGHARFEVAEAIPDASAAQENIMYLVMNAKTGHYDIYAKVGDKMELLDDTTVDLSGYVQKETGKGLSTNDYTTAEKTKLAGMTIASDADVTAMLTEVFGA